MKRYILLAGVLVAICYGSAEARCGKSRLGLFQGLGRKSQQCGKNGCQIPQPVQAAATAPNVATRPYIDQSEPEAPPAPRLDK